MLRAKIDMASPNINLRDPAIYRIRHATHHNTGDAWCIYPMYTFAHPIEDALENITHSICTLEFEDQRPFYDWLLERWPTAGCWPAAAAAADRVRAPQPDLRGALQAQADPAGRGKTRRRLGRPAPAHAGRRAPPRLHAEGFRMFAERIGVSKSDSWIDMSVFEECMREHLNETAPRRIAVLDPVKLVIDNYAEGQEELVRGAQPSAEAGARQAPNAVLAELWIEREDFMEVPSKGYFRLFPGNMVRLRYGFVIECTGCDKDAAGNITAVHCRLHARLEIRHARRGHLQGQGQHALGLGETRLCHRSAALRPAVQGAQSWGRRRDFLEDINPDSVRRIVAQLEPSLKDAAPEDRFQFERHGYFVADRVDSRPGTPVFNRAVTLKDSWGKAK
jgi:glutaminyl-tRNA synthetase